MTNQEIINKYLNEFHEVHGIKVPIELNPYIHRMMEESSVYFLKWCIRNGIEPISTEFITAHHLGGEMASPILNMAQLYEDYKKNNPTKTK